MERNNYSMPKNGICHGSCLVSTKLEGNKLIQQHSLTYRDEILQQSSLLQQKYHNMRNPDNKFVFNLFIEKITGVIKTLDNGPCDTKSLKRVVISLLISKEVTICIAR